MKKKNILIVVLLIIIIAVLAIVAVKLISNNSDRSDQISKNNEDEIYLNILKNTDKNGELTLNANEKIKYYYFDIVNYNEEEQKFNQSELTPYVKIVFNNNDEKQFIDWKLYSLGNETDTEELWTEVVEKGEEGTNFTEYYKCKTLGVYDSKNKDKNSSQYVMKIVLDTEKEEFVNLEENLTENFSIVLGYRENK